MLRFYAQYRVLFVGTHSPYLVRTLQPQALCLGDCDVHGVVVTDVEWELCPDLC